MSAITLSLNEIVRNTENNVPGVLTVAFNTVPVLALSAPRAQVLEVSLGETSEGEELVKLDISFQRGASGSDEIELLHGTKAVQLIEDDDEDDADDEVWQDVFNESTAYVNYQNTFEA